MKNALNPKGNNYFWQRDRKIGRKLNISKIINGWKKRFQ